MTEKRYTGLALLNYISSKYEQLLYQNQLSTFEQVWSREVNWFETPNQRRGGWSGVGRVVLEDADGTKFGAYLKRQENHCRTAITHPRRGVPTFQREFEMMQYLERCNVPAPEVLLYGRNPEGDLKATLLTKELAGFEPFDVLTAKLFASGRPAIVVQRELLKSVAQLSRKLHDARVQHRSFYPKHIFVQTLDDNHYKAAVIDLEKSRIRSVSLIATYYDLTTLHRHAKHWSMRDRIYFLKQYLNVKKLSAWHKSLARLIHKRANRD